MRKSHLILGSALTLNSCGVAKEEAPAQVPTVDVGPSAVAITDSADRSGGIAETDDSVNGNIFAMRAGKSDSLDPIFDERRNLWECISLVDGNILLNCSRQIAASTYCYDKSIGRINGPGGKYNQCLVVGLENKKKYSVKEVGRILDTEKRCIDEIRAKEPAALNGLAPCYRSEMACLRAAVKQRAIMCSEEEENASGI